MAKPIHPSAPREMTEDEADFEVASRRESQPSIPLEEDPRPHDAVELRGHRDYYRVRFEGYRVVYRVSDSRRRVAVLRIRRRDQAYRGLESP